MERHIQMQTANKDADIDSLRDEYESSKEWRLRRKFLEMNLDSLSVDRLICLSRCFINIAMYGCLYYKSVMVEVEERSAGILDEIKSEKKNEAKMKYAASFVKATNDSDRSFEVVPDNSHFEEQKTVPQIISNSSQNSVLENISHRTQISETTNRNIPLCELQTLKTSVNSSYHDGQNSKTCGKIGSETTISKAAVSPGNISYEPQTLKTSVNSSYHDGQNSKTCGKIGSETTISKAAVSPGNISYEPQTSNTSEVSQKTETMLSKEECLIAFQMEQNSVLKKFRKLAYEVLNLKVTCHNAKEQLHSAGNRVPVKIDFNMEHIANKNSSIFLCHVLIEDVEVASEKGSNMKLAKTNACEAALKTIMMPKIEIVQSDNKVQFLKGSALPHDQNICHLALAQSNSFLRDSRKSSTQVTELPQKDITFHQESNRNSLGFKRKHSQSKLLQDFIIVEQVDGQGDTAVNILRRSADFNHMLLEYDFFPHNGATRCIVKIEGEVCADIVGSTKPVVKATASEQCLGKMKTFCWVLKLKQAVDSNSSVSKEEIQKEISLRSEQIDSSNIGNKLLQKMGWSGGGIGKKGQGIAEPVSMMQVLNRQGLGLGNVTGVTDDFRKRIRDVIQNYASSENQDDLAFSNSFTIEERKVIHEECRKLNLKSTSRGKGQDRCLCVSRKRSANQLFQHVMMCGGETAKYKLVPPGADMSYNG